MLYIMVNYGGIMIEKLAFSLERNDEEPNIELAKNKL